MHQALGKQLIAGTERPFQQQVQCSDRRMSDIMGFLQ